MEVILKQDVKDLGKKDSLVKVSDGYAKNYLMPRGLAVPATAGNINEMKNKQQALADKQQRELDRARQLQKALSGKGVRLKMKAGENGKLFGAVSGKDIAEAAAAQLGVSVDKKKIVLSEPIKTTGTHSVQIRLHAGVNAELLVTVEDL